MPKKSMKIEFCTSCGSREIKVTGNKFYCPVCDVTYKVTEDGTKVVNADPLGKEKARIAALEGDVAELKGQKPAEPAEPEPDPAVKVKQGQSDDDPGDSGLLEVEFV